MAITKGQEILVFAETLNTSTNTSPSGDINSVTTYFDDLVNATLGTAVADKAEDVRNKLWTAISELSKTSPDTAAARGNIDGARTDLQAMINDGLIDHDRLRLPTNCRPFLTSSDFPANSGVLPSV